ncbi:hypothetical protein M758_UG209300 [Ceratodon purpureus]|nr:hypothetical protein M758_UG209300 [Ceratodon purpureus]
MFFAIRAFRCSSYSFSSSLASVFICSVSASSSTLVEILRDIMHQLLQLLRKQDLAPCLYGVHLKIIYLLSSVKVINRVDVYQDIKHPLVRIASVLLCILIEGLDSQTPDPSSTPKRM